MPLLIVADARVASQYMLYETNATQYLRHRRERVKKIYSLKHYNEVSDMEDKINNFYLDPSLYLAVTSLILFP